MRDIPKEHLQAQVAAANGTASQARTEAVSAVRHDLGLSAKATRSRIKVFRANRAKPWARLWTGQRVGVPAWEGGTKNPGVLATAPPDHFVATMKSGHKGAFYRANRSRLPVKEHRVNIKEASNRLVPGIAERKFRTVFDKIYARELAWRLQSRGWKR